MLAFLLLTFMTFSRQIVQFSRAKQNPNFRLSEFPAHDETFGTKHEGFAGNAIFWGTSLPLFRLALRQYIPKRPGPFHTVEATTPLEIIAGPEEDIVDSIAEMDLVRRELFLRLLICWLGTVHAKHGWFFSVFVVAALRLRIDRLSDVSFSTNCRLSYVLPSLSCRRLSSSTSMNIYVRSARLKKMVSSSDVTCCKLLRMHRRTFDRLCQMLDSIGGLKPMDNLPVDEQVAICLHILAHPVKDRVIGFNSERPGKTVSKYFSLVLKATIKLHRELTKKPEAVPEDSTDEKWRWFKNCLGAVDCAHIKVKVPLADQGRYRNRKGEITTNVLWACSQDGQFTYILPGWEGSASNWRVLSSAILRGLKVPQGQYYLIDSWFWSPSCEGFLAPYRGKRSRKNQTREEHYPGILHECFNTRHSIAFNVIKRCFGMLKLRWAILRNLPFYKSAQMYNLIIIACCLLQNLILQDGADPLEDELVDMEAQIFNQVIHKKAKCT